MRKIDKRLTALLLSLCLVLGLAACGKGGGEDDSVQLTGTVYVPKFTDLDLGLGENGNVRQGCTDGTNVYVLASNWDEDGGSSYEIYRVPVDGGAPEKLENFQLPTAPEGYDNSYSYADSLRAGAEGTLWVGVTVSATKYDLPEGFDPETDSMWQYDVLEELSAEYQIQLDSTGNEISRVDITGLEEKVEVDYIYSEGMLFDRDGDLYICNDGKIVVLDPSMNVRFTLEDDSLWGNNMVLLSDGTVGARLTVNDIASGNSTSQLRVIDKAAKNWGTGYALPLNAYELYPGGGDYLFYYQSGENICGFKADGEEGEKLLNWLDSDINSDEVQFFSFLPDGRLVVMTNSWGWQGDRKAQMVVLTATDRSEIPEKTILTYATMYLSTNDRNRVLEFNKTSQTHRIEVKDYSEYRTEDDYMAGLQKLNTEIIAGNVPDIINVNGLPIRQYGAKGYLEDLWPFIDGDPELGREKLMERVFTAAEQEGKLYQIFDSFQIETVIGSRDVVGDRMSWTLDDLKAALDTMPEGCAIFGDWDTKKNMLQAVMSINLDRYVDWDTGVCSFDSDEFKSALEFCNSFPAEYTPVDGEYDSEYDRIMEQRQMLSRETLSGFEDFQLKEALFGGPEALNSFYLDYSTNPPSTSSVPVKNDWGYSEAQNWLVPGRYVSFVGYPKEDGSCGSSFGISNGLAMSSTCKDKETAWSFMRESILPLEETDGNERWSWSHWGFPANREQFERMAAEAMEVEYMTDGNGDPILDPNGNPVQEYNMGYGMGDDMMLCIQATTQEEYDQVMELYNTIDTISGADSSIFEIVNEVADSYFAGDKTLDETVGLIQNRVNIYVNEQR